MIVEYFRPKDIKDALNLLSRPEPLTIPLGGGTTLSHGEQLPVAVVDLQDLPLNQITREGHHLRIGSVVSLQQLLLHADVPPALVEALRHEATLHLRNMATVAGSLVTADGKSPLATAFLALDARLLIEPGERKSYLGDWLPKRDSRNRGELIVGVEIPLQVGLKIEMIGRSPEDRPVICVAIGEWSSGRTRIALGGAGNAPILAMDGPARDGAEVAVENAYANASDAFASGEYRSQAAVVLVKRLLSRGENFA
jgi:CO/xanthine dehydrogenase FAD-binding subunit